MNVVSHFEAELGEMSRGWGSSTVEGVSVGLFEATPFEDCCTLATIGLSLDALTMRGSNRGVRQELVCVAAREGDLELHARMLLYVAETLSRSNQALLRGDAFPLPGGIHGRERLLAAPPGYWSDGFAVLGETDPATVVVQLIPIDDREAAFITEHGVDAFLSLLEESQVDLTDPNRCSVVRGGTEPGSTSPLS